MSGRPPDGLAGAHIAATAAELIRFESLGGAEHDVLEHVAGWLAARGVSVRQMEVGWSSVAGHPFASAEIERDAVPVLIAEVAGTAPGPTLLLNAHVDVVPAAGQEGWTADPFEPRVDEGSLVGRGAADTKGGLAAAMHVMATLAANPGSFRGRVLLTPVPGEEDGGSGTLATLMSGVQADGAVVIEPTDLSIAVASAGALCFRISVPGRTAHGSVRHAGVSAIEKGWLIHRAVLDLEAERAASLPHPLYDGDVPFPICMGRVEGGDYRCDEAAWLHLEGRFGTHPAEPVADARRALEDAVARVCAADPWLRDNPATVAWIGAQWVGGDTDVDHPLVMAMRAAAPSAPVVGVPYGCDMGLLRQVGDIPTVVFGPGAADVAHAPGEHVPVADLATAAAVLHRLATAGC